MLHGHPSKPSVKDKLNVWGREIFIGNINNRGGIEKYLLGISLVEVEKRNARVSDTGQIAVSVRNLFLHKTLSSATN